MLPGPRGDRINGFGQTCETSDHSHAGLHMLAEGFCYCSTSNTSPPAALM
jgi:hypothetical protein